MESNSIAIAEKHTSRLTHAWLGLGKRGGIHVFSIYGWTGEGMSARNKELLGELARMTAMTKGPWVVGGDLNLAPEQMQKWCTDNHAYACCPDSPTCNLKTLDYFLVHRSLADAVVGTQCISDLGGRPHHGVRLILDIQSKDSRTWRIRKPAQIPSGLPAGCRRFTPTYSLAKALGPKPTLEQVSKATQQWYDLAESEWVDILGLDDTEAVAYRGRSEGASFVQKFPSDSKAASKEGATDASLKWRNLATWTTTLLREANCADPPPGLTATANQLRTAIGKASTWKVGDHDAASHLKEFTDQLVGRRLHNRACLAYIIKFASREAATLEAKMKAERNIRWGHHIAGRDRGCASGGYRYTKGPIGAQNSPVMEEDHVEEELADLLAEGGVEEQKTIRLPDDKIIKRGIMTIPATEHDGDANLKAPQAGQPARSGRDRG